jgi:hypothetical protein
MRTRCDVLLLDQLALPELGEELLVRVRAGTLNVEQVLLSHILDLVHLHVVVMVVSVQGLSHGAARVMQATREGYARTHRLEEAVSFFDDPAVLHRLALSDLGRVLSDLGLDLLGGQPLLCGRRRQDGPDAVLVRTGLGDRDTLGGQDGLVEVDLLEGDHLCVAMSILSALNTC